MTIGDSDDRCGILAPCQAMDLRLKDGTVWRDWSGSLKYGTNAALPSCPWCNSYLDITPEQVRCWDMRPASPQADGSP